jgi:hypothetical protein
MRLTAEWRTYLILVVFSNDKALFYHSFAGRIGDARLPKIRLPASPKQGIASHPQPFIHIKIGSLSIPTSVYNIRIC